MKIQKQQRQEIKEKYGCRCAYCGEKLGSTFHVDHLEPIKRISKYKDGELHPTGDCKRKELDMQENMMPSCASCNILKSDSTLGQFRESVKDRLRQMQRQASYKTAIRYNLIKETPHEIVFYFKKDKR